MTTLDYVLLMIVQGILFFDRMSDEVLDTVREDLEVGTQIIQLSILLHFILYFDVLET